MALGAAGASKVVLNHYRAEAAAQKEADAAACQAGTLEFNQVSAELKQARNDRKIVYWTITQNVPTYIDRPVYQRECLDDDGLRDVNAALAAARAREPAAAMPGAGAARR